MSPSYSYDLSAVDREILDLLESAEDDHGNYASMLGADIAHCVGVPANAIGSRLSALVRRGYIYGWKLEGRWNVWALTEAARRGERSW